MTNLSRPTLEADLMRYQHSGDFAAHAETLFALAEIAYEDQEYNIAQGLYGQAWAAYKKVGNQKGLADTMLALSYTLNHLFWDYTNRSPIPPEFGRADINLFYDLALGLYIELDDRRGQAETYTAIGHEAFDGEERAQTNYKLALNCYEALDDRERQALTLISLSRTCETKHPLLEQALGLYQQIGDKRGEANILFRLGELALREKKLAQARSLFEASLSLFIASNSLSAFSVAETLGALILETGGYAAYHTYSMSTVKRIRLIGDEDDDDNMFSFWKDLAKIARKHQDFETAACVYQQAGLYTVGIGFSERRADIYWRWGHMQYHALKRREAGFAMCESAVALMYDPDELTRYQKKLEHMRGEMAAYRRKNRKS